MTSAKFSEGRKLVPRATFLISCNHLVRYGMDVPSTWSSAVLLGGVGGRSERTKAMAMTKVTARGENQTMFMVGMSEGPLRNKNT